MKATAEVTRGRGVRDELQSVSQFSCKYTSPSRNFHPEKVSALPLSLEEERDSRSSGSGRFVKSGLKGKKKPRDNCGGRPPEYSRFDTRPKYDGIRHRGQVRGCTAFRGLQVVAWEVLGSSKYGTDRGIRFNW